MTHQRNGVADAFRATAGSNRTLTRLSGIEHVAAGMPECQRRARAGARRAPDDHRREPRHERAQGDGEQDLDDQRVLDERLAGFGDVAVRDIRSSRRLREARARTRPEPTNTASHSATRARAERERPTVSDTTGRA